MSKKIPARFISTLVFVPLILLSNILFAQMPKEGVFKDWGYTPFQVVGLIKLNAVNNRAYFKISWVDKDLTEIRKYNAAGNITNTTMVEFYNGRLKKQTNINEWNDTTETVLFTDDGGNNFIVTRQKSGRNDLSPAKCVRYVFGTDNTLQQIQYLSDSNKLINTANGAAIILYKRYTDENRFGEIKEAACFDANYNPVVYKSLDYHRVIYERDENDDQVSRKYFDTADMPVKTRNKIAEVRSTYDAYGQLLLEEKYDSAGNLTADAFGIAKNKYEYENGFIVKESRFDVFNRPAKTSEEGDGIAVIKYQNDIRGNHIEKTFYDEKGRMINGKNGYHKVVYQYSNQDMMMGYVFFNAFQEPATDPYGIHRYSYDRDNKGRTIQVKYYNNNDLPCKDKLDEVYMVKYMYDSLGRTASVSYWFNDFMKMKRWNGYHSVNYNYDADGKIVEYLYKDINGVNIKNTSGFSRKVIDYYPNGLMSKLSVFNGDTAATMLRATIRDYHAIRFFFGKSNLIDSLEYFNADDQPGNAIIELDNDVKIFAHKVQFIYKSNTVVQQKFYQADSDIPSTTIDCVKSNYVLPSGVGTKFSINKD